MLLGLIVAPITVVLATLALAADRPAEFAARRGLAQAGAIRWAYSAGSSCVTRTMRRRATAISVEREAERRPEQQPAETAPDPVGRLDHAAGTR